MKYYFGQYKTKEEAVYVREQVLEQLWGYQE
jgi:hypothetical protein